MLSFAELLRGVVRGGGARSSDAACWWGVYQEAEERNSKPNRHLTGQLCGESFFFRIFPVKYFSNLFQNQERT